MIIDYSSQQTLDVLTRILRSTNVVKLPIFVHIHARVRQQIFLFLMDSRYTHFIQFTLTNIELGVGLLTFLQVPYLSRPELLTHHKQRLSLTKVVVPFFSFRENTSHLKKNGDWNLLWKLKINLSLVMYCGN
jgi:hypothetical protein